MRLLLTPDPAMGGAPNDGPDPSPDDSGDMSDQSFFLPASFPGSENYKPGDTITLKVVGQDADGDLEVQCEKPSTDSKDMMTDLRDSVPNKPGPY